MDTLYCRQEKLTDGLIREIDSMLDAYYHATVASNGIPPYDFLWDQYRSLEQMGILLTTTARYRDRVLVGLCMYICLEHPHHAGLMVAECDTISTRLEYRGSGIAKKLYLYTEPLLRIRGVSKIVNRYRHVYNAKPMFEGLGFDAVVTCYVKELT